MYINLLQGVEDLLPLENFGLVLNLFKYFEIFNNYTKR